jgi:hypothetical protein
MVMLSPDLRERAKSADASLQECVRLWLLRERAEHEWLERQSRAKRRPEIHLVIAEEAGAKPAIGSETHAIAASALRVSHRGDHADRAAGSVETGVRRRTIAA